MARRKDDPNSGLGPVIAGHPFVPIGMGEQVRACFRAFRAAGANPMLLDIFGSPRTDSDYQIELGPSLTKSLSSVANIFSINGDEVEPILSHLRDPRFASAANVVMPAWELPTYPA